MFSVRKSIAILITTSAFFSCSREQSPTQTPVERGKYLVKIAQLIRTNAKELAELETRDTGKTTKQTTFIDVPTCADTFEYFGKINKELDRKVLRGHSISADCCGRMCRYSTHPTTQSDHW